MVLYLYFKCHHLWSIKNHGVLLSLNGINKTTSTKYFVKNILYFGCCYRIQVLIYSSGSILILLHPNITKYEYHLTNWVIHLWIFKDNYQQPKIKFESVMWRPMENISIFLKVMVLYSTVLCNFSKYYISTYLY